MSNGIALRPDGSFLIANISDAGGLLECDAEACPEIRIKLVELFSIEVLAAVRAG